MIAEVAFIDPVDLGCDLPRDAGRTRYSDHAVRALFGRNPPHEGKVASSLKRWPMSRRLQKDSRRGQA